MACVSTSEPVDRPGRLRSGGPSGWATTCGGCCLWWGARPRLSGGQSPEEERHTLLLCEALQSFNGVRHPARLDLSSARAGAAQFESYEMSLARLDLTSARARLVGE